MSGAFRTTRASPSWHDRAQMGRIVNIGSTAATSAGRTTRPIARQRACLA
ncbi:MAG: hypothetical protein U1E49_11715 [Hyphomicrobiaceae bacterium]